MKNKRLLLLAVSLLTSSFVVAQAPVITSFSPASGNVGTLVNITGTNFSVEPSDNIVFFGATRAVVTSASPVQLDVIAPIGATYELITVTVNGLTASSAKPFSLTFSNSAGSFGNQQYLWAGGQTKWGTVADIDGDGKTDILAVDEAWSQLYVWRNTSTAGIISWDSFSYMMNFPTTFATYALEVEDLDGDGKPDVVVTNNNSTVGVFQNTSEPGNISFAPQVEFAVSPNPLFISIRDIDNDGKQDIAVACANDIGTGGISILRNTSSVGSLAFDPHVDFEAGTGGTWCVRLEDIDVDGKTDMLITSGGSQTLSVFRNIGSAGSINSSSFEPRVDYTVGDYPAVMNIGDFDQDGKPDVVVGNAGSTITLFRNVSTAGEINSSSFSTEYIATTGGPWNPTAGDVDGDRKLDIVVRNTVGEVQIYKNHSNPGSFTFAPPYNVYIGGAPLGINIADMDGDEKADLVISNEGWNVINVLQNITVNPPVALPAYFISNSGFEAQWNGAENAYEYRLDVSPAEDFSILIDGYIDRQVFGYPWETMHITVGGLQPETNYYYRVRAINNGTSSPNSETILVHTNPNPALASPNIWARQFGGWGEDEVQTMTSDNKGNIYVAGHFTGSFTMGSTTLNSLGEFDIFFAKLDANGNVQWARSIGGYYHDNEVSLAVDEHGLYLTAQYSGDIDVDPGSGNTTFTNEGLPWINDGFFARYNVNTGDLVWARHLPDAAGWSSSSIGMDKTGVYLTGHFVGSVDFNPGAGVQMLHSAGGEDIFLAKYSLDGNYIWSGNMGGWYNDTTWGLLVDETGVYIHGYFEWGADFDPGPGETILNGGGGFFGRYDLQTGKLRYVKNVGNGRVFSMSKFGKSLFIAGDFRGMTDVDPSENDYYIGDYQFYNDHAFIGKYDMQDGKFRWANGILTTGFVGARKILTDASGVYVSGYFAGNADFDGGPGEANRSSAVIDAFAANYSREDGSLLWAKGIGRSGRAVSIAATLTNSGYYLGGLFAQTVDFNPYTGSVLMTSTDGGNDIFIAKFQKANTDSVETVSAAKTPGVDLITSIEENSLSIQLYPNPATDVMHVQLQGFEPGPVEVTTRDTFGRLMIAGMQTQLKQTVDIGALSAGVYILQARQGNRIVTERFIKK